jgi:hypothetical protein
LATAAGPASAGRAVASVRGEYGPHALPEGLLRRVAASGCWSDFGAKLPPEALAEDSGAPMAQQQPDAGAAGAAVPAGHRRRKTLGASFWRSWAGSAAVKPAKARQLQPLTSFAYIEADATAGDAAEEFRAWCASFFLRVDALCLKRADGARPAPADVAASAHAAGAGGAAGPWQRLGALKRRNTYWWGGKAKEKPKPLERRNTLNT